MPGGRVWGLVLVEGGGGGGGVEKKVKGDAEENVEGIDIDS